jgi:hypothetical protein
MSEQQCTAFAGMRRIASGPVSEVALQVKHAIDRGETVLVFDDATSETVEIDCRGSAADIRRRLRSADPASPNPDTPVETPRGPGRPRLGVVAREVTLLPRHWDWLNAQPGGASVALRKLVDEARRVNEGRDRVRRAREAAYRFMSTIAGNLPRFEEAARALFAGDGARFAAMVAPWPKDVREHAEKLAMDGLEQGA